ncbi:unnamed protein product [Prorocentrum cordatum]|uniref:F-actin-capping protein subunit beta n=1 Tax=Prorocentrum cordatum TaxID=2364126 RepID=A0ABN9WJU6_9DINO|nr:unnamed protein product [Polarella glacialis]
MLEHTDRRGRTSISPPWPSRSRAGEVPPLGRAAGAGAGFQRRLRRLQGGRADYDGGVSSAYLWDLEEGFAGAFLIRKVASDSRGVDRAVWDSVHLVEVRERATSQWTEYKISTTVLLHMEMGERGREESELAGHITRQAEKNASRHKKSAEDMHLPHIGRLIEDMENQVRQSLDHVYMAKQREVVHAVRSMDYADLSSAPAVKQVAESAKDEKERRQRNEKERQVRLEAEQEVKRHFQQRAEEEAAEKAAQVAQQRAAEDAAAAA